MLVVGSLVCTNIALGADSSAYMFETNVPRKAFVAGITNYLHEHPIPSASKDEASVKEKLGHLGFDVTVASDEAKADANALRQSIIEFFTTVKAGDIVVFYFSGHGFWYRGESYLVPANADNKNPPTQPDTTLPVAPEHINVSVSEIVELVEHSKPGQATIVIDACRNAPSFPMTEADRYRRNSTDSNRRHR